VTASSPSLARFGARALSGFARLLPARLLVGLAELGGSVWYALSPGRRRIAHENLRIAFGDGLDRRARTRIVRASCRGLARVFAEITLVGRLLRTPQQAADRLRYVGDWAALEEDAAAGRAGLIVSAHLGNWELGAFAIRHRGVPLRAMARPLDSALLDEFLTEQRGGPGAVIRKVGGLSDLLRSLRGGDWVALLADQNAGRHGIFVPFFGLSASTYPTPAALAARFGVPVYIGTCLRRPGPPCSFDVHMRRLAPPDAETDRDAAIEALMRAVNEQLEAWIRAEPTQYNWVHRRWKTRPPGRDETEPGRPFYARLWPLEADGTPMYGREPME